MVGLGVGALLLPLDAVLFLWYVAALNHVHSLDYTGAMATTTGVRVAAMYAFAAGAAHSRARCMLHP